MQQDQKQKELYVFPTRNKRPLTPQGFKNARLESQWTGKESDQWGLPCGEKNGFFVIDIDEKSGGLETAKGLDFGDTLIVNTPGGGFHAYYLFNEKTRALRTTTALLPGLDIRSQGSYVVAYESIKTDKIKEIPESLFSLLIQKRSASQDSVESKEVAEGNRNAHLTRKAGKMQRLGVLTLAALSEVNERECFPPLDQKEVEQVFNSVMRYAPEVDEPSLGEAQATDLITPMLEYLNNDAAVGGESTGIEQLDNLLGGGKRLGELSVMLAEAKSGKNTFWHYQMVHMLDRGISLAYASRELDPATEVMPNLVTLAMGQNIYKSSREAALIKERIKKWCLVFSDGIGQYDDVSELFIWLEAKIKEGIKYLWIDHLHFCLPDSENFKDVSKFIRALRTMARSHMVHIDLIIQPKGGTTQHDKNGKLIDNDLDIGSLRGGASLGQGLDNLITMQRMRDEDGNKIDVSKISLKTSRNKLAKLGSFYVQYDRDKMTFSSCSKPGETKSEPTPRKSRPRDTALFDLSKNGYNLRKGL